MSTNLSDDDIREIANQIRRDSSDYDPEPLSRPTKLSFIIAPIVIGVLYAVDAMVPEKLMPTSIDGETLFSFGFIWLVVFGILHLIKPNSGGKKKV